MTRHIFRSPRCCFITTRAAPLCTRIAIGSQHSVFEFFFRVRHDVGMPWCRGSPAAAADANSTRNARRNRGRVVCDSGALPGRVPTAFCERGACAGELVILRLARWCVYGVYFLEVWGKASRANGSQEVRGACSGDAADTLNAHS